jgi:hypothetical protein
MSQRNLMKKKILQNKIMLGHVLTWKNTILGNFRYFHHFLLTHGKKGHICYITHGKKCHIVMEHMARKVTKLQNTW